MVFSLRTSSWPPHVNGLVICGTHGEVIRRTNVRGAYVCREDPGRATGHAGPNNSPTDVKHEWSCCCSGGGRGTATCPHPHTCTFPYTSASPPARPSATTCWSHANAAHIYSFTSSSVASSSLTFFTTR